MENNEPHTGAEGRWRGYGLPESGLPDLLRTISTEIDNSWQEEQARVEGQPLTVDSYRRVSPAMGSLALNVTRAAFGWYRRGNEGEKEMGGKILLHYSLPSIFFSIERVKRHYPQAGLDEEDMVERGLVIAMEMINNIGEEKIDKLSERIDNSVFVYGQTVFARKIGLPVNWVKREWHRKIPAFREEFLAENGRHPSIEEIIEYFNIGKENAPRSKRILQRFLYPGEESEEPVEDRVIEMATAEERKKAVGEVLSTLPGQQRTVLKERFGLDDDDDREKTLEEVGRKFGGLTKERIRQIEAKALRELRHPSRAKKIREYLR